MPDIDAKKIAELRSLLAKATLGPWSMIEEDGRFLFEIMSSSVSVYVAETSWHDASPIFPTKEGSKANFDLIVAMRNALPALLDLASKTLASARVGEDSPAGILDVQRMLASHQPTGWLAHDIAIASARLQPQVSASGGEDAELADGLKQQFNACWDARKKGGQKIRVICQQTTAQTAAHVGGPTATDYLTFEVDAPEVVAWFRANWDSLGHKSIIGVEVPDPPAAVRAGDVDGHRRNLAAQLGGKTDG